MIYYLSSKVLWSFSYHLCIVYCWPVFSHWAYQRSLILKLVLGCVRNVFFGSYPNRTYGLAPPAVGLSKVVVRVPVWCSNLFAYNYCFAWYTISIKFFVHVFFCWFLTCVYHNYWIRMNWTWNLLLGVLTNCQWAVSIPDIQTPPPPRRFV